MQDESFSENQLPNALQPENNRLEYCRVCPLCQSAVRLFFINFNEKMVMCEKPECEYPFGHEELQFFKEDNEINESEEVPSVSQIPADSESVISATAWAEIETMNKAFKSEDSQSDVTKKFKPMEVSKHDKDVDLFKNIKHIQKLNKELANHKEILSIKNEKWIRNLKSLGQLSGCTLLKPEEAGLIKKPKVNELKIDINPGDDNTMSLVKIEILNKESSQKDSLTEDI